MKLTTILVAALSMFCLAGNAAADQPTTVEFEGPWTFIVGQSKANCGGTLDNCIVAISPSRGHKKAVLNGGNNTQKPLKPGVYFLMLQNPQPDSISGKKSAQFVSGLIVRSDIYKNLIATSSGLHRYIVILPYAPLPDPSLPDPSLKTSFEEPPTMGTQEYSERARITDYFVDPFQSYPGGEGYYTKGVRIHYIVSDLSVTLSGTDNNGATVSVSEKAAVTFTVAPSLLAVQRCDLHARQAFADMNDLFHPYTNPQPRKYVDFPTYSGFCRFLDPQQNNGAVLLDTELPRASSKEDINISAVLKLIEHLKKLNSTLQLKNVGSQERTTIDSVLKEADSYLRGQSKGRDDGQKLVVTLDQVIQAFGDLTNPERSSGEKELIKGIAKIQQIITILNGPSGANCKAPMMSGTVQ